MSLKRRLGELERLEGRPGYAPSRTEIEAWALNDEIAQLEEQMKAEGLNPWPIATEGGLDGDLDFSRSNLEKRPRGEGGR